MQQSATQRIGGTGLLVFATINILSVSGYFMSIPVLVAGLVTLLGGYLMTYEKSTTDKNHGRRVFLIVFIAYYFCTFIISHIFDSNHFYYVSDAMRDIDYVNSHQTFSLVTVLGELYLCYFEFADNNALFQISLNLFGNLGRNLDGVVPTFYITQMITAFGAWSSIYVYRLIRNYYNNDNAVKYALTFCLLSAFLLYSTVVIRDIIICFFYLIGYNVSLSKFRLDKLILLIILFFIIWGIRFYSGLFFLVIVCYYLYSNFNKTKWKFILVPMLLIGMVIGLAKSGMVIQQSTEELSFYQDLAKDRSVQGGLSNSFDGLPVGIKQIVLLIFSQFIPFPPYSFMLEASTFPQFFLGTLCFIMSVWWFFIFYTLLGYLFFRMRLFQLPTDLLFFVGISFVYILLNTAQIDIRRMIPVYPLLYLSYLYLKDRVGGRFTLQYRTIIGIGYVVLILAYSIIK